jgi:hypothetical protein
MVHSLVKATGISFLQNVQKNTGNLPASYSMGIRGSFPVYKVSRTLTHTYAASRLRIHGAISPISIQLHGMHIDFTFEQTMSAT